MRQPQLDSAARQYRSRSLGSRDGRVPSGMQRVSSAHGGLAGVGGGDAAGSHLLGAQRFGFSQPAAPPQPEPILAGNHSNGWAQQGFALPPATSSAAGGMQPQLLNTPWPQGSSARLQQLHPDSDVPRVSASAASWPAAAQPWWAAGAAEEFLVDPAAAAATLGSQAGWAAPPIYTGGGGGGVPGAVPPGHAFGPGMGCPPALQGASSRPDTPSGICDGAAHELAVCPASSAACSAGHMSSISIHHRLQMTYLATTT